MKKRVFGILASLVAILLSVSALVSVFSFTASAADGEGSSVRFGSSWMTGGSVNGVYFGTYSQSSDGNGGYNKEPVLWRVLSNDGEKFFLQSDRIICGEVFSTVADARWDACTLRSFLNGNFLNDAFSEAERNYILTTALQTDGTNDTQDKLFCLSLAEAENSAYFSQGNGSRTKTMTDYVSSLGVTNNWWYLRVPTGSYNYVKYVDSRGGLYSGSVKMNVVETSGVAPAFNMSVSQVLYMSAESWTTGNGLNAVPSYSGNNWSMTMRDNSRSGFTASVVSDVKITEAGRELKIRYSGARSGENEYVSAMLLKNGKVIYYGHIAQNSTEGEATLTVPQELAAGGYSLRVFSEQDNGAKATNYASEFQEFNFAVRDPAANPKLRINETTNEWEISYDDGASWTSLGVKATGTDGKDGSDGMNGVNGKDGADGRNGLDGKDGVNGVNGKDGADGKNGIDGKDNVGTPWLKPVAVTAISLAGVSLIGLGGWILFLVFKRKSIL